LFSKSIFTLLIQQIQTNKVVPVNIYKTINSTLKRICSIMLNTYLFRNKPLVFILMLGFIIRLTWVILVPNTQWNDALSYKNSALHLASTGDFYFMNYRAFVAPGYPFFLSLFYIFGPLPDICIKLLQVVFSTISIALLYYLCRAFFHEKVALSTAFVFAIYLNQIAYCSIFLTEMFFTFLLLLYVALLYRKHTVWIFILQTLSLTGMAFTKPQGLPLALIIALMVVIKNRQYKHYAIQFSICILVLLLWMGRNYNVIGRFVFTSNASGNLYVGNNDNANGKYQAYGLRSDMDEVTQMDYYKDQLSKHQMPANKFIPLLTQKFFYLYIADVESIRYWIPGGIADEGSV
jgi:4-amino-4-deoxy-L-arabinose transferase-like glycosyltransferase